MTTLLVPDVRRGRGTGHIRRCVRLARLIPDSCVLVSENSGAEFRGLDELADLTGGLDGRQIVGVPPETVDRVIIDHSGMASGGLEVYGGAVTIGLDLGGDARPYCSYLVDTIPRVDTVPANIRDIGLLDLPTFSEMKAGAPGRVLVSFGGEDPAMLTEPTVRVLVERLGLNPANLSVIRPGLRELSRLPGGIQPL